MPHHARLLLRIGALASSLLLLTGFVAFRAGLLPPESAVTQDQSNASLNFNSIGAESSQPNTQSGQAELPEVDQPGLLDVKINYVGTLASVKGGDRLESRGNVLAAVFDDSSAGVPKVTREVLDELRRRPGQASPILIRHDALTLMSGSKSIVLLPTTPADTQKATDKFKSRAAKCFSDRDRNGDGKLTKDELGDHNWKRFLEQGAVENDAVDSDGFLKNFFWYANQK